MVLLQSDNVMLPAGVIAVLKLGLNDIWWIKYLWIVLALYNLQNWSIRNRKFMVSLTEEKNISFGSRWIIHSIKEKCRDVIFFILCYLFWALVFIYMQSSCVEYKQYSLLQSRKFDSVTPPQAINWFLLLSNWYFFFGFAFIIEEYVALHSITHHDLYPS